MRGTKEFYEMQNQFEKDIKQSSIYTPNFDRVKKDENLPKSVFYQNGTVNNLFQVYMMGYSNGKLTERMGL